MVQQTVETGVHEEWISVRAACDLIGVSPATLRRWSNAGAIATFTTPGGHRRFPRSAVLGLLPAVRRQEPRTSSPRGPASRPSRAAAPSSRASRNGNGQTAACAPADAQPEAFRAHARRLERSLVVISDARTADERDFALDDARALAVEFGRIAARHGLELRSAVEALLRLRPPLDGDSADTLGRDRADGADPVATPTGTTDLLLRCVMEGYEQGELGILTMSGDGPMAVRTSARPGPAGPRGAPGPTIVALVAHARDVASEERENFADQLADLGPGEGMIVVRTCHRTELYATPDGLAGRPLPEPPPGTRRLADVDAVQHLISVACGLESTILGEDQILCQLREALAARQKEGALDPVLSRLFQVALHAGRRAHAWFGGVHRSLGDVAVDRIHPGAGTEEDLPVLIVGAGTMGRLAALAASRRELQVIVANRTYERAVVLARDVGGRPIPLEDGGPLPPVAGVIVALSGTWQIAPEDARRLVESEALVVDLSSPPAVPAELQRALGNRFVSIDDLAWGPRAELPSWLRERLERLVSESGGDFCSWLRTRDAVPAIQALTRSAEEHRKVGLEWLNRRLPDLTDDQRALVAQMSNRMVAGILHAPRSALTSDASGELGPAALQLFGL